MKRTVLVAFSMILLCCLSLPVLVNAAYSGYSNTNYQATQNHVEDGKWTTTAEWTDAMIPPNLPANFHWRETWTWPTDILEHFLAEALSDSTNDTGDYFQLCIDCQANGGTAPQSDDIRVDYVGHRPSGLALYKGTGTGWANYTSYTLGTDLIIAETLSSSPTSSTAHFIVELMMDRSKADFDVSGGGYAPWIRLAVFDASTNTLLAWPPTSRDVPNDWGLETGTTENIPESLTIMAVVILSSVALIAGSYFLRKRTKTVNQMTIINSR